MDIEEKVDSDSYYSTYAVVLAVKVREGGLALRISSWWAASETNGARVKKGAHHTNDIYIYVLQLGGCYYSVT